MAANGFSISADITARTLRSIESAAHSGPIDTPPQRGCSRHPQTRLRRPCPPEALSAAACEEWRRFVAAYHLAGNLPALVGLEAYCRAFDRHRQAREVIDRDGIVLTGARGGQRAHPLLRVEHTAAMDMQRALRHVEPWHVEGFPA